jgi:hypothetical protein
MNVISISVSKKANKNKRKTDVRFYECKNLVVLISICTMWCIIISLTIRKAVRIRLLSHHYHHHHHHHCPTTQHTIVAPTAIAVDDDSLKRENARALEKKKREKEGRECYREEKM